MRRGSRRGIRETGAAANGGTGAGAPAGNWVTRAGARPVDGGDRGGKRGEPLDALGLVEPEVAALGLVELASSSNGLVASCLIQALAVAAGVARTPSGLVVARR